VCVACLLLHCPCQLLLWPSTCAHAGTALGAPGSLLLRSWPDCGLSCSQGLVYRSHAAPDSAVLLKGAVCWSHAAAGCQAAASALRRAGLGRGGLPGQRVELGRLHGPPAQAWSSLGCLLAVRRRARSPARPLIGVAPGFGSCATTQASSGRPPGFPWARGAVQVLLIDGQAANHLHAALGHRLAWQLPAGLDEGCGALVLPALLGLGGLLGAGGRVDGTGVQRDM
jgi:hypothetical protein